MTFNPSEPRDERGRWAAVGGAIVEHNRAKIAAIKFATALLPGAIASGLGLHEAAKKADEAGNAHIMRKAEQLKRQNNKIAGQRTKHPRDNPHMATEATAVAMKKAINVSPEAAAALNRELLRNKALTLPPEKSKESLRQSKEWRGMGTGLRPGGVVRNIAGKNEPNDWKPKIDSPSVKAGNIAPYSYPVRTSSRAITRETEFPPSRYTTKTTKRRG